jgi:hypothetical protein
VMEVGEILVTAVVGVVMCRCGRRTGAEVVANGVRWLPADDGCEQCGSNLGRRKMDPPAGGLCRVCIRHRGKATTLLGHKSGRRNRATTLVGNESSQPPDAGGTTRGGAARRRMREETICGR